MPRTLPAALKDQFVSLSGSNATLITPNADPYIIGYVRPAIDNFSTTYPIQIISYSLLAGRTLNIVFATPATTYSYKFVCLRRGLILSGAPNYIDTPNFHIQDVTFHQNGTATIHASLISQQKLNIQNIVPRNYADTVIEFASFENRSSTNKNSGADYWSYQFYPSGKDIILNRSELFLHLLEQKYFMGYTENGPTSDILFFANGYYSTNDYDLISYQAVSEDEQWIVSQPQAVMWTDELGTLHKPSAIDTQSLRNLGFLPSTAKPPTAYRDYPANALYYTVEDSTLWSATIPINLWLQTGDYFWGSVNLIVNEHLDTRKNPSWYCELSSAKLCTNTAGGAMPSTIERISNYTPLNTSGFGNVIPTTANNLQAAMDEIDDHTHDIGAIIHATTSKTTPVDADELGLWDSVASALRKLTWANLKATLKTYFDGLYPQLAHTHSGTTDGSKLAQANTHQSPDTDSATTSLHHTIGTSATQAAAGNHGHTDKIDIGGWVSSSATWTYSSADSPTFVISINADVTALIYPGARIKLTQTTVKYFIVTAVGSYSAGATLVTVYGGTDYTLANAAISSPYYSQIKAPTSFPLDPLKWTVEYKSTTPGAQASPTTNTWYNVGSASITIPIGSWRVWYTNFIYGANTSVTSHAPYCTLSTANNSESDIDFTGSAQMAIPTNTAYTYIYAMVTREKNLTLASKTTYYMNMRTIVAASSIGNDASRSPLIIRAICNYL